MIKVLGDGPFFPEKGTYYRRGHSDAELENGKDNVVVWEGTPHGVLSPLVVSLFLETLVSMSPLPSPMPPPPPYLPGSLLPPKLETGCSDAELENGKDNVVAWEGTPHGVLSPIIVSKFLETCVSTPPLPLPTPPPPPYPPGSLLPPKLETFSPVREPLPTLSILPQMLWAPSYSLLPITVDSLQLNGGQKCIIRGFHNPFDCALPNTLTSHEIRVPPSLPQSSILPEPQIATLHCRSSSWTRKETSNQGHRQGEKGRDGQWMNRRLICSIVLFVMYILLIAPLLSVQVQRPVLTYPGCHPNCFQETLSKITKNMQSKNWRSNHPSYSPLSSRPRWLRLENSFQSLHLKTVLSCLMGEMESQPLQLRITSPLMVGSASVLKMVHW